MEQRFDQATGRWWGARVIEIRSIPTVYPAPLSQELLSACSYARVSAELLCVSEATDGASMGTLRLMLILRENALEQLALTRKLDEVSGRVADKLNSAGFDGRVLRPEDMDAWRQLVSGINREQAALFFTPEPAGPFYVPQGRSGGAPLPLGEITELLIRHPGSAFMLQLTQAALMEAEQQAIVQNSAYFDQLAAAGNPDAALGAEAFQRLQGMIGQPLYFLSVAFVGPQGAQWAMAEIANRSGMSPAALAADWLAPEGYPCFGMVPLSRDTAVLGHAGAYRATLTPAMRRLAHLMTMQEATALLAIPRQGRALAGATVADLNRDLQPIHPGLLDPKGIPIGERTDRGESVFLPHKELTRHAVVVGMPGTGKTTFSLGLLYQLRRQGYPFLAIEPTKREYRALIDAIPDLQVYTPGRSDVVPVALNPFLPPEGVTLEQYLPCLTNIFAAAFSMTHPLDVILPDVLRTCYTRYGWRNQSTRDSKGVTHFGLHEFVRVFRESIQRSGYDPESKSNLLSGGSYRLQTLLNSDPALYDTDHTIPYEALLEKPTVIELDAIDNAEQKSLILMLLLTNLMLVIRQKQETDGKLKNVILMDEAHLLLGQRASVNGEGGADPTGRTVQMIQNMVAQIRAYGTAMIFADQSPEKLTAEVVGNANVKVVFRLDSERDRALLAGSIGMTQSISAAIRTLPPGQAYISCGLLERPIRVRMPNTNAALSLRSKVEDHEVVARMGASGPERPFAACANCASCAGGCRPDCRQEADFIARALCDRMAPKLTDEETIKTEVRPRLEKLIRPAIGEYSPDYPEPERLKACLRMSLKRRILLVGPAGLREEEHLNP